MDLVLFILFSEVVIYNLSVKKGHMEFWENLQCCTAPHITAYITACCLCTFRASSPYVLTYVLKYMCVHLHIGMPLHSMYMRLNWSL